MITKMPDGFAAFARGRTIKQIRAHFRIGYDQCSRFLTECGLQGQVKRPSHLKLRPPPADFREHASHRADTWLSKHYAAGRPTILRWRKETGVKASGNYVRGNGYRAIPDDFADVAPGMTAYALEGRYKAGSATVARWLAETGIVPISPRAPSRFQALTPVPAADVSIAGRAAQHLRSFYPSVYRADILPPSERRSLPDRGRGFYVVSGKGALPAAEVIALAEKRGFDPQAWARI